MLNNIYLYIYIYIYICMMFCRYHDFPQKLKLVLIINRSEMPSDVAGHADAGAFPYDTMLLDLAWTIALTPR